MVGNLFPSASGAYGESGASPNGYVAMTIGIAMSIIKSRVADLHTDLCRTSVWTADTDQRREPTLHELNRLICSGFYLNCAKFLQSTSRASQYFSVF